MCSRKDYPRAPLPGRDAFIVSCMKIFRNELEGRADN